MTEYRVKSGQLYFVRFHEDGTGTKAVPAKNGLPEVPAKPGKPNLSYPPVFTRDRSKAAVFTDSEDAATAAQMVQQCGKEASLDPELPKPVAEPAAVSPTVSPAASAAKPVAEPAAAAEPPAT